MLENLGDVSPVLLALIATLFTWGVTALGAASVFLPIKFNQKLLDTLLGFAGGVMIAASFWSLLSPAIALSEQMGLIPWLPPLVGFLLGGVCLRGIDLILPHLHLGAANGEREGIKTSWERSVLLGLAITLHNIPEGLAVGVAFGAVASGIESATIAGAATLAIGIGLQNFPEGIAVAMPLRREGMSRMKSFVYGQLSALVEPIAGVIGAAAVLAARPILPYALSFAAGAMIFVVVEDVIPEAYREGHIDLATAGVMIGFAVMMTLDVALG
ncbi:MAG: ZIP family metal transporter [Anaerolineaceae bacterium]|nr:ZIP family metal transporter [Anaerolineaceae bacterium]